jgi:hypothetical protein
LRHRRPHRRAAGAQPAVVGRDGFAFAFDSWSFAPPFDTTSAKTGISLRSRWNSSLNRSASSVCIMRFSSAGAAEAAGLATIR